MRQPFTIARDRIMAERNPIERAITLSIRGKFDEEAGTELERCLHQAREQRMRVYLDLSEVTLVDQAAARYLAEAGQPDVSCVNCPAWLQRWILADTRNADTRNNNE
jgi:hypothetical protein